MNENNMESKDQKNIVDEDLMINFTNNLIENENNIDDSEIINMSTDLLQNELLMNFVENLSQFVQIPILNLPENQLLTELILLKEQLKELDNKLGVVKKELMDVKKEHNDLSEIIVNLGNRQEPTRLQSCDELPFDSENQNVTNILDIFTSP